MLVLFVFVTIGLLLFVFGLVLFYFWCNYVCHVFDLVILGLALIYFVLFTLVLVGFDMFA